MPLKLFDFLCVTARGRQVSRLIHSFHGETRSPCPFRLVAEAER